MFTGSLNKSPAFMSSCLIASVATLVTATNLSAQDRDAGSAAADTEIVLFDGSNLDEWQGYKQEAIGDGWVIEDGVLHFNGQGGGDIVTRRDFTHFDFSFEWAVTEGANSGIMYKVGMGDGAPYITGPEYQILDNAKHQDGKNPMTSAASLYGLYAPEGAELKPVGEWNSGRIRIQGNHIEHWLNGVKVVETELGSDEWRERLEASKFRDWEKFATLSTGRIALQDHGDEVMYRNLKITVLDGEPAPKK